MKIKPRKGSWILFLLCIFGMIFSSPAKADSYTVTSPTDYYFYIEEPTEFIARTFMYDGSPDTHLWLYGINNELLAANDDYYGLQSFLSYQIIEPGIYRLRAGVCCGDPNAWRSGSYELSTSLTAIIQPEETTTTIQVEETTTTVEETTTTTSSTTIAETTTTTVEETTTTTILISQTTTAPLDTTTTEQPTTTTTTSSTTIPRLTTTSSSPATSSSTTTTVQESTTTIALDSTTTTQPIDNTQKAVNQILNSDMESITTDQAKEIFKNINIEELTDQQKIDLVLAVNQASEEVKKEFEKSIDVFGSGLDEYVPSGSNINVGARRAIIAVTTILSTITVSLPSSSTINNRKQ